MANAHTRKTARTGAWPHGRTIVAACFFAMLLSYADRVNMSVAAIAMQTSLNWTEAQKGVVLSSFFVGYMLTQILGGWLANVFGGKRVLIAALAMSSVFTVLTPVGAHFSFALLIATRIGLGLSEAPINPSAYNMFGRWVPASERARSVALYSSAGFLGVFVALIVTGWAVEQWGWQSPFLLFGLAGLVYSVALIWLLKDEPRAGSDHEPPQTQEAKGAFARTTAPVPWSALLRQRPFWALVFSFFCTSWCFYVLLSWMPSYFATAHHLPVARSSYYSMASWIIMFVMMNIAGWVSDALVNSRWSATKTRKLMTSVGLFGAGASLILLHKAATPEQALVVFCCTLGFLALAYSSQAPNVLDIAPRYADVLFGILNTFGSLPGIIGVSLTGVLLQTTQSFDAPLAVAGVLALAGSCIYLLFGTAEKLVD